MCDAGVGVTGGTAAGGPGSKPEGGCTFATGVRGTTPGGGGRFAAGRVVGCPQRAPGMTGAVVGGGGGGAPGPWVAVAIAVR